MHIEVRWLRRGKLLDHFLALLPEIKQFLIQESQVYPELDENWILDVAFLVDITDHLNMLNESLQGKNHLLPTLIANVRKFMLHMLLMSTQLSSCDYTHFPHLKKMLDKHSDQGNEYDPSVHLQALSTLAEHFENGFSSLRDLKPFLLLLSDPFEFDLSKCGVVCQRLGVNKRKFEQELIHVHVLDEDEINQLKRKGI
ncbi:unnamed protein product [Caretta caretta]